MNNFSKISLKSRKIELMQATTKIRESLEILTNRSSEYAEHHQHLINTYSEMIETLDDAIKYSEIIGVDA